MTDCRYCGDRPAIDDLDGYCSKRCATDAPAARQRMAALLAGKLPPPSVARTRGVDEIAVELAAKGIRRVPLNPRELDEVVIRMTRNNHSADAISQQVPLTPRSVHRRRIRLGIDKRQGVAA